MNLELALSVSLMPGLAGVIGVLDGRAVLHMLPAASRSDRRPEIIEHVAMESDPFGRWRSCSNSWVSHCGQAVFSARTAVLSSMVRAMDRLRGCDGSSSNV